MNTLSYILEKQLADIVSESICIADTVTTHSGYFEVTFSNNAFYLMLKKGMIVENGKFQFSIKNITFRIIELIPLQKNATIDIGDMFFLSVNYQYDYLDVLNKTLNAKEKTRETIMPLAWLLLDYRTGFKELQSDISTASFKIAFAYDSVNLNTAADKEKEVSDLVLEPLATLFIESIINNKFHYFFMPQLASFVVTKDRKNGQIFNRVADVLMIEFKNLNINNLKEEKCIMY